MADQGAQNNESFTLPINVDSNVTPDVPIRAQPTIGLIGMGYMYATSQLEEVCVFSQD